MYIFFREDRFNFIRAKYVDKCFALKTCQTEEDKFGELEDAINNGELNMLLQAFAENVDINAPFPTPVSVFHLSEVHPFETC